MTNWLDNLDTLPDLRKKSTRKPKAPKAPKANGQQSRIAGETHPFISVTLEQFNQNQPQNQRGFGGDIIPPVFRQFLSRELEKAKYTPSHILGVSPYWPEHNQINWSL